MELHQIRYFLIACETKNFTRAAELRNVSQPALTKAIHNLEYELGGALFDTQSRPIQLTAFGKMMRERFTVIDGLLADIKSTSAKFHRMEESTFTIGIVNTIGDQHFIDMIKKVQEQLIGVSLIVQHGSQEYLTDQLKGGALELAILTGHPLKAAILEGEPLYSEPYMLCVHEHHPFAHKEHILLEELSGEYFIIRDHCEKNSEINNILLESEISVQTHLRTNQDEFARKMIQIGLGLSIMPAALISAPLKAIPIMDLNVTRELRLVHRKTRLLSPIASKVKNVVLNANNVNV